MPLPELLATTEAAKVIDVERSTLSRWIASGRITPAHKLPGENGAILFTRTEVDRVAKEYAEQKARRAAGFPAALPNECENTTEAAS